MRERSESRARVVANEEKRERKGSHSEYKKGVGEDGSDHTEEERKWKRVRISEGPGERTALVATCLNERGLNDVELSLDQSEDTDEKFDGVSEGCVEKSLGDEQETLGGQRGKEKTGRREEKTRDRLTPRESPTRKANCSVANPSNEARGTMERKEKTKTRVSDW